MLLIFLTQPPSRARSTSVCRPARSCQLLIETITAVGNVYPGLAVTRTEREHCPEGGWLRMRRSPVLGKAGIRQASPRLQMVSALSETFLFFFFSFSRKRKLLLSFLEWEGFSP